MTELPVRSASTARQLALWVALGVIGTSILLSGCTTNTRYPTVRDAAVSNQPMDPAELIVKADSFNAGRRYGEAADHFAAALQLRPDSLNWARRALGPFWRSARYVEGYRWGQRVLAKHPEARDVLFNMGVICGFLVELDCLEAQFRRMVALYPDYALGHGELGFLMQSQGDPAGAVLHMEKAFAVAPGDDFALSGLVQMLIPAGQASRAIDLAEPRLAANRRTPAYGGRSLLTLYGWALKETGDSTGANAAFHEVLSWLEERERAGQTSYQLYRERAAIYALQGRRDAAVAAMKAAFDRGWRLYGAWTLADPMFDAIQSDAAVVDLLNRMREDTRQKRHELGLSSGQ